MEGQIFSVHCYIYIFTSSKVDNQADFAFCELISRYLIFNTGYSYTKACSPVIALPKMRPDRNVSDVCMNLNLNLVALTMYIALAFIRLSYKQICNVSSNSILVADGIATKYLL